MQNPIYLAIFTKTNIWSYLLWFPVLELEQNCAKFAKPFGQEPADLPVSSKPLPPLDLSMAMGKQSINKKFEFQIFTFENLFRIRFLWARLEEKKLLEKPEKNKPGADVVPTSA